MITRNILLLEPAYKNKYPPLGLMKIAAYHKEQGKGRHNIVFAKGENDPKLYDYSWDRIYITTLFSFEWKKTEKCIDKAVELVSGELRKIFVGGIAASLMTEEFCSVGRWQGIRFIQGLLDGPPADSLQLNGRDFGWKDRLSTPIEEQLPDYNILDQVEYQYPVHDAYFGYASRGCIRKCAFCGVPKLEGEQRIMPSIYKLAKDIEASYGSKKDLILMDNNITAAPNFKEIIAEIRDLGFVPGAKLKRGKKYYKRRVDFNQGVDSRLLAKNPALLQEISTICIDPLRIAFDHLGLRKPYEKSIRSAADNGIRSLSNYMLYNFHDTPEDLYQRLLLNIELNDALNIRIWSFPMRYQPVNMKDRTFIGKRWNRYYLRSFQVMLQATHGIVSGNPDFFGRAFGRTMDEFQSLLLMPHEFIFNRSHYFIGDGRPILDEYLAAQNRLTENQRAELVTYLTQVQDAKVESGVNWQTTFDALLMDPTIDTRLKSVLRFHLNHYQARSVVAEPIVDESDLVPEDKKVEDAGLYEDEPIGSKPLQQHIIATSNRQGIAPVQK